MNLTIKDFRDMIGTHSAGYVEFARNNAGDVTGLKKVANHVTMTILNERESSVMRRLGGTNAHEMRHAFVDSLRKELGANLPGDVVRSILFSEDDVNSRPLSRREIRTVMDRVDAIKNGLVSGAHDAITAVAVSMGAAERLSNNEPSPLIACAKEGYVAIMTSLKDCFRPNYAPTDEHIFDSLLLGASKFRDVCDRYQGKLNNLQQVSVHTIIMRTIMDELPELREWAMNNDDQLNKVYGDITAKGDEWSDLPGADGSDPSPAGIANHKKLIAAGEARQIMATLTDIVHVERDIPPVAATIANEFANTVGATQDEVSRLVRRMLDAETLKGYPRNPKELVPQLRSLMTAFAEIRRREALLNSEVSSFENLVGQFANTPGKILALNFKIQNQQLNAFARKMHEDMANQFKSSLADRQNWAHISSLSMRESNPGKVRINGVVVPDHDDSEFTLEDGTVVNKESVKKINIMAATSHADALVKSLLRNIPDAKMRAFVSNVISMSKGPHGTFDTLFHGVDDGPAKSNMMTMLMSGTNVTQMPSDGCSYDIDIADEGTVTIKARTREGFAISATPNGGNLALEGEDPIQLRIPLVFQDYETTITITPNSFDADGVPQFTVTTRPVD